MSRGVLCLFKASTACGGGGILLCKMTEGADVAITVYLFFTIVGAALAAALI